MRKILKYIVLMLGLILIVFLSLDIKKLDAYKSNKPNSEFNAAEYAVNIWTQLQKAENSNDIEWIIKLLYTNPEKAFESAKKLGISKTRYFMVNGTGTIETIEEEFIVILLGNQHKVRIATDFIFGNAVRDGSGLVNIDDFVNMTDFNNVSVELNKRVKEKVIPGLEKDASPGRQITFTGAFEMNEENINPEEILIIPVDASIHE